jgi:GntR family transcriptional regulator, transcriptional repressor for pyruvate dehydrogenase complex
MPISAIESRRLYLQIAGQLRSLIVRGEFPPGSRLPAERELAKQFGVSRPSLREALIALEVEGYVDVRPGSGILVTTPKRPAPDCSDEEGPLEIMRARCLLEAEVAAEAARRMKPKDLAVLEELLLEMEQATADASSCLDADRRFHLHIASKLANNVVLRLVTDLLNQRNSLLGSQFAAHFDNARTWAAVLTEHRKIIAALAARDPQQARDAMHNHLLRAHNRWARQVDRGSKSGAHDERKQPSAGDNGVTGLALTRSGPGE